jgi:hypothetical protein
MKIDWDRVKAETLWSYEDLIRKLQDTLSYPFVQEHYDHTLPQARAYAAALRRGYLHNQGGMTGHIDAAADVLKDMETRWAGSHSDLLCRVGTRSECVAFLEKTGLPFDGLLRLLNYLLRWVLPFKTPLREFVDLEGEAGARLLTALAAQGIKSNLDLLEAGRTVAGRAQVSSGAGVPQAELLALVHRADISRLAYVRGKTVAHLCGGGFDTLEKLARADLPEVERRMAAYYLKLGKTAADFRSVIPLAYMIGGARTIPRVVTS